MPLGTLDRTPPPFFKQGPSALSKLIVFSALALFLMVADLRFGVGGPLRTAVARRADHFDVIDPTTDAYLLVLAEIEELTLTTH